MEAPIVIPTSPAGTSVASRRMTDEVMVDMSRLMDEVRQDVMTLMQDGLQKTASFCAHQCAKRVLAARRDMHKRLQEQKREIERAHSLKLSSLVGSAKLSPASSVFPMGTPRVAEAFPFTGGVWTPMSQHTPRSMTKATPQLTPRAMSRTSGEPSLGVFDTTNLAYDTYIDAHGAVQDLEEKTRQASRALDLIEEAIKVTGKESDAREPALSTGIYIDFQGEDDAANTGNTNIQPADAALIKEAIKVSTGAVDRLSSAALTPTGATPRGRTPRRGDTPPHSRPEAECEFLECLPLLPPGAAAAAATADADSVIVQMPLMSQRQAAPAETVAAPTVILAATFQTSPAVLEEGGHRRDLSVGSVISAADSVYSVRGMNLHGC